MGNCDSRIHFRIVGLDDGAERRFFIDRTELTSNRLRAAVQHEIDSRSPHVLLPTDPVDSAKKTKELPYYYVAANGAWARIMYGDVDLTYMRQCASAPGTLARPINLWLGELKV